MKISRSSILLVFVYNFYFFCFFFLVFREKIEIAQLPGVESLNFCIAENSQNSTLSDPVSLSSDIVCNLLVGEVSSLN